VADYKAMVERLEDDADFRATEASKRRQAGAPRASLAEMKRLLRRKRSTAAKAAPTPTSRRRSA
jgi:hypothetical protein